ncbi:unnamed protein product [Prunus brigantina]
MSRLGFGCLSVNLPLSFSVFVCLCHSLSQSMNSQQGSGLVGKAMNSRRSMHGCLDKIFGSEMRAFSHLFGWRKFMDGGRWLEVVGGMWFLAMARWW